MTSSPTLSPRASAQVDEDIDGGTSETAALLEHIPPNVHPALPTSTAEHELAETENPNRPKGFRFAVVFACILMGDFFVGYVGAVGAGIPWLFCLTGLIMARTRVASRL